MFLGQMIILTLRLHHGIKKWLQYKARNINPPPPPHFAIIKKICYAESNV